MCDPLSLARSLSELQPLPLEAGIRVAAQMVFDTNGRVKRRAVIALNAAVLALRSKDAGDIAAARYALLRLGTGTDVPLH